ncbi:hypothetical protein EVAR_69774_1 [Eumeta japonica]|uniref:Uncharacterized protein n=1 Tax=Eumeta variegata TaxID=151549 RepID=A0A4C2A4Y9_EUMVA|nr:hypothetical protein EVAR_69774_1 [Eumeta japonica]
MIASNAFGGGGARAAQVGQHSEEVLEGTGGVGATGKEGGGGDQASVRTWGWCMHAASLRVPDRAGVDPDQLKTHPLKIKFSG